MSNDVTVAELAARLARIEDERAIEKLLLSYGPAADSGDNEGVAGIWTDDGVYEITGLSRSAGHDEIIAVFEGDQHQGIIHGGSAHLSVPAKLKVDGDTAAAITYSVILRRGDDSFWIARVSANRWSLRRVGGQWRVTSRIARLLDGAAQAREILGEDLG